MPGTLGGQDRHSQRPGNFIRKSVHMIPPDSRLSLIAPSEYKGVTKMQLIPKVARRTSAANIMCKMGR